MTFHQSMYSRLTSPCRFVIDMTFDAVPATIDLDVPCMRRASCDLQFSSKCSLHLIPYWYMHLILPHLAVSSLLDLPASPHPGLHASSTGRLERPTVLVSFMVDNALSKLGSTVGAVDAPASPTTATMLTFVPAHPNLKASSFANNSPNPSINPFTKGNSRFIPAPLSKPHMVGGEYRIIGELEDEGGESDNSLLPS